MAKRIMETTKILAKYLKRLTQTSLQAFIVALCKMDPPRGINQIRMEDLEGKDPMDIAEKIINCYTIRCGPERVKETLKNINENQIRIELGKALTASKKQTDSRKKKEKKAPNVAKAAPQTSGGCVNAADQKDNIVVEKKATGMVQLKGDPAGTSQRPGEDIKPKRGRKPKSESKTTQKSPVNIQVLGRAAGRKRVKEKEEDVKPKRTRKQPTSDKKHFVIENRNKLINSITQVDPVLDDLLDKELLIQEQYDIIRKKSTSQDKMRELFGFVRSWGPKDKDKFRVILEKHNPIVIKNLKK